MEEYKGIVLQIHFKPHYAPCAGLLEWGKLIGRDGK
jgi:hypothetical protein